MKTLRLLLLFQLTLMFLSSYSQNILRGNIADKNGEAIIGAIVVLKNNPSVGTVSDYDGNFSLEIPASDETSIRISMLGFDAIEDSIAFVTGKVQIRNFVLSESGTAIQEVVITAKAQRASDYFMENVKKKSANSIDFISAEVIKKTGDNNVTAAIARVSGVSTNGSFITVRGIGDRYVKTSLNGLRIPTLDPFTNNLKLDLFPTAMVDNIILTKTYSPDLPGDWSGAYISVETKDYPDKLTITADFQTGFNVQNVFRSYVSTQRSTTDPLGIDNGYREINHGNYVNPVPTPNQYEEFSGLGLSEYYSSLGVNSNWIAGTESGNTYFKLGLVQLGLLDKAQFNNTAAINEARQSYLTGPYKGQAFEALNGKAAEFGKTLPNNWEVINRQTIPNFSGSFSIGNQIKLFKRDFGFLVAVRYGSSIQFDPNSINDREDAYKDSIGNRIVIPTSLTRQKFSRETFGWSALVNLAYKLNKNHSISMLFMPNILGVNNVRLARDTASEEFVKFTNGQFYEHRRQLISQLKTEHFVPSANLKIELNASYTLGVSNAPDFKNLNYLQDKGIGSYQIGGGGGSQIQRYYRYLDDNVFDSRLNFELGIKEKPGLKRKLKFGGAYQYNYRKSLQYVYDLFLHPDHQSFDGKSLTAFFDISNFGLSKSESQGIPYSKINAYYFEFSDPANKTFGYSHIGGGYTMIDYTLVPRVRFAGGLRVEYAKFFTDVIDYYEKGYPVNDYRRFSFSLLPNPGNLRDLSFLPSSQFIFRLNKKEELPINLRVGYSYTTARPSLRELSETLIYDYELRALVLGNSNLKPAKIHNMDLRIESYFKGGNDLSVSFFGKKFKNHIELVSYEFFTWQNVDKSFVLGAEIEGKVNIYKGLDLRANVAYVYSQSTFVEYTVKSGLQDKVPVDTITRTMFGQAPYIVNAILSYQSDKLGLNVSASYNVQGPRLVISGISTGGRPDVYERPRHLLDVKVQKTIGKYLNISVTGRNLLNSPVLRTFRYDNTWHRDFDRFRWGQELVLGLNFKF